VCDTASGTCVACVSDTDCADPAASHCDPTTHTCTLCTSDAQCTDPALPACNTSVGCVQCTTDAHCAGNASGPVCYAEQVCTTCTSSFECSDPASPACQLDRTTGQSSCTSYTCAAGDDAAENGDDGPAGATDITPTGGTTTTVSAQLCDLQGEADWYVFNVADGDHATLTLDWTSTGDDFDLYAYDANGEALGYSWYAKPEVVSLTYLPAGPVYVRVEKYTGGAGTTTLSGYTLALALQTGNACSSAADCAAAYATQIFRGQCGATGACTFIDGQGALADGTLCDSQDDCTSGLCTYGLVDIDSTTNPTYLRVASFAAGADTWARCTSACTAATTCGQGLVCTTAYGQTYAPNVCQAGCTSDNECPINLWANPSGQPWVHLTCDTTTGLCH
jgi:hypothetical protein